MTVKIANAARKCWAVVGDHECDPRSDWPRALLRLVNASTEAQQQVFALVIAAPEPIRVRFRGQIVAAMLNTAAKLRVRSCWDIETTSTVVALRTLARRAHAMLKEAREHQKAIVGIIRGWRPDLLEEFGVGPIVAATVLCAWSHPGRIHCRGGVRDARRRRPDPGEQRPRPPRGIGSTGTAIASSTEPCTPCSGSGSSTSRPPATTSPGAVRKESTSREIKRCLARYVARDLYRLLENGAAAA